MSSPEAILNLWRKCLHWFVARFISVQNDSAHYAIALQQDSWQIQSFAPAFGWLRIIPRTCYAEYQRSYPVVDLKDLKAVLAEDHPKHAFHLIAAAEHNQRLVTTYIFDASLLQQIQQPCFLLPESLLLAKSLASWPATIQVSNEPDWYIYASSLGVISQLPNAVLHDLQLFRLTLGVPETVPHVCVANDDLPKLYLKGIQQLPLKQLATFFHAGNMHKMLPDWRPILAIGTVVGLLHLLVSGWLIGWQLETRKQHIDALGPKVDQLLALQAQHQQWSTQIAAVTAQQQHTILVPPIWQLVLELLSSNIKITGVEQQGTQLELRGSADRATEVLLRLQQTAGVSNAAFVAPTRRINEQEQFHIQLSFNAGAANAKK